jgi:hypothetical protein
VHLENPLDGDYEAVEIDTDVAAANGVAFVVNAEANGPYKLGLFGANGAAVQLEKMLAVLSTAVYINAKDELSTTNRIISISVNDGSDYSNSASIVVSIQPINDHIPVLSIDTTTRQFTEGDNVTALLSSGELTLTDIDHNEIWMMQSAKLTIVTKTGDVSFESISVTAGNSEI